MTRSFSGKYEVKKELGRGGMGVIYEATQTALNRSVAIKVLHSQFTGDSTFLKRFQREARAMARLDHEHIIRVFDVSEDQGAHYIVMEYFPGRDLKQLILEQGKFSPPQTLAIAYQVADALAYAHAQGIVHRDIKPGNIMVDARGRVKITDFGIAAATDEISVTATGQIIGTPEYMSPEQARGEPLDGRSDLYSLGMVLYEMLAGRTPFEGISRMAVVGKLLYDAEEHPLSFPPEAPLPLQEIVRSLVKKKSRDRIENAELLTEKIRELEKSLAGDRPVPPAPQAPPAAPEPEEDEATATVMLKEAQRRRVLPDPPTSPPRREKQFTIPPRPAASEPLPPPPPKPEEPLSPGTPAGAPTVRWFPFVAVGVVAIFLVGGLVFYLSSVGERPSLPAAPPSTPAPAPAPLKAPEEALTLSLNEIRQIQKSIQEIEDHLSVSRSEADAARAPRWASESYRQASDLRTKGLGARQAGENLINQRQYADARTALIEAKTLLGRADEGYAKARDAARQAAEADLAKKRAAQRLKEIAAEKEQEARRPPSPPPPSAKPAPAPAPPTPTTPPRPDIEVVSGILSKLKSAYENHDLQALREMSALSDARLKLLQQIFQNHSTIKVSIAKFSLTGDSAQAVITITKLIGRNGEPVTPAEEWKQAQVQIHKEQGKWGKVVW